MNAPACPACGGTLSIVADGRVGRAIVHSSHRRDAATPIVWQRAPFAACDRCEFAIEIDVRRAAQR